MARLLTHNMTPPAGSGEGGGDHGKDDGPDREVRYKPEPRKLTEREKERLRLQHRDWLKYIVFCAFAGAVFGIALVAATVRFDLNGIGTMIANSPNRIGFTALLTASFASTFAAIAMGIGIMVRSSWPHGD